MSSESNSTCRVGVAFGEESKLYSFPNNHPLSSSRTVLFENSLKILAQANSHISLFQPAAASEKDLLNFHSKDYIDFVKASSKEGSGFLDYGDTPSFQGVFEASLYPVGTTIKGMEMILEEKLDHFLNPVGGLHHARPDTAGGFCVFNDAAVAIVKSLKEHDYKRVAYVDIDAHHGDGVFYGFEADDRVVIGDIHEDGLYIYPGTGHSSETGKGKAKGTKLNIPLAPGSGDQEFFRAFERIDLFVRHFEPEFIFFQCGADGLAGDPLTHIYYTEKAHAFATNKLHTLAHEICGGRILAMGGGGYNPKNVEAAWMAVLKGLCPGKDSS